MADRRSSNILLEELEVVGGTPGSANGEIASRPGEPLKVIADPRLQYVSGSQTQWYANYAKSLSFAIDDVTADFGADLYSRMLLDSQVASVINVLKSSVLEEGISIAPAVDKEDDGYDQAKQIADDAEHMFSNLTESLDDVLWNMLDAFALGNKMAEQVYALDTTFSGKQQYVLTSLSVKPRESVAFVVDSYLTVLGILGRIPGQPFSVQQGTLLADIEHVANLLPRSKFAVLTFRPRDRDPRGTSVLRPAFQCWNDKQQLKREYLKYLTQFGTPSLIGFTPEGAQPYPLYNADGTMKLDANGNPITQTPETAMVTALQAFANGTATAFPGGSTVQPIEMTGDGSAFGLAMSYHDQQITKAVLNQILATEEGQHQTRAATGGHKDILDTVIRQCKRPVERMLERDVLMTWLRLNYGDKMLPLCPKVTLGVAEQEDLARLWMAVSALNKADYLHDSQYAKLDAQVGLPERTVPEGTTVPVTETIQVQDDGTQPSNGKTPSANGKTPATFADDLPSLEDQVVNRRAAEADLANGHAVLDGSFEELISSIFDGKV